MPSLRFMIPFSQRMLLLASPWLSLRRGRLKRFNGLLVPGRRPLVALLATGIVSGTLPMAQAQNTATLTTLYTFSGSDGAYSEGTLVLDRDGNLYGTTYQGGNSDDGTVFRITPAGVFTTLHSFDLVDGAHPSAGLALGSDGNLYGTTANSGSTSSTSNGYGTVFRITPAGEFKTLHNFTYLDGDQPITSLVQGRNGEFYGTTSSGGTSDDGTVFHISSTGSFTSLYSFKGGNDGRAPSALVQGNDGNFYGTTSTGGSSDNGTVFRITPAGVLTTLYSFNFNDGIFPEAGLLQGNDGNFYGTTADEGDADGGTVFQLTPAGVFTKLADLGSDGGSTSRAALVQGSDGSFYGTTYYGGVAPGYGGTTFEVNAAGVVTYLYSFDGNDGKYLPAGLVEAGDGNFYGTTYEGGSNGYGTIFKLTVTEHTSHPAFFTGEESLGNDAYYLNFPNGNYFGFYSYLNDPDYLYHFDLGYEYVFDAADGNSGVYLYDFASSTFFYTSPVFPFPYLYDFSLNSVLYYYPTPNNAGHYTSNPRYFYDFNTGTIITK